jgi:polysaccharide deacetylase family protein (PEP-CTERM system associated)
LQVNPMPTAAAPSPNALTFDVEDWYQGIEIGIERWPEFERRLDRGLNTILELLAGAGLRATFFVLGQCAADHPELIRAIAAGGHEIGCHGWSHTKVYEMTPATFAAELARAKAVLQDVTGQAVRGHRAPYFSITAASLWALPILWEQGFRYDSSIYPGSNYRYGIPGSPQQIHRLADPSPLVEFPLSVLTVGRRRCGLGGAYFRILPYAVTRWGLGRVMAAGQPAAFYLHPWEFDPRHPRVAFARKARLTHYANLGATLPRFRRLLRDVAWAPMGEVLTAAGWLP